MFLVMSCALLGCAPPQDPAASAPRALAETHGFRLRGGAVRALALSNDGRLLASGGVLGDVQVFDIDTRECVCAFDASSAEVRALAFDRNGRRLAVLASDLTTWGIPAGARLRRVQTGKDGDLDAAIGWRGDQATLVAPPPERCRIFGNRVESGAATYQHDGARSVCAAVDAGGELLATGGDDGRILLWQQGRVDAVLGGHAASATSVAVTADGQCVAATDGRRATVLDAGRGVRRELDDALVIGRGPLGGLTVLGERHLRWLDAAGQERARAPLPRWPDLPVAPRCRLAVDPGGTNVLVSVESQTWLVRLGAEGVTVATRDAGTHAAAWWPDGRRCVSTQGAGGMLMSSCGLPRTEPASALLAILDGRGEEAVKLDGIGQPAALAVSPDGSCVACAGATHLGRWSVAENRVLRAVEGSALWVAWLDHERLVLHDGDRVAIHSAASLERQACLDPWRGDGGWRGEILSADLAGTRLVLGTTREVRVYQLR